MELSGQTRVVGIFGDPIAHSLSPVMQNAAIQAAAIDAVYVPFHVTSANLPAAIDGIRTLGLAGVNLTLPHKEAALSLVDELDATARVIGAINVIVNREGRLIGYNTDGDGLCRALQSELGVACQGKHVLLLGAGGACRAAAVAIARAGARWVGIANRTMARASELVVELRPVAQGTGFASLALDATLPANLEQKVDLLVNTTSVGLHGESFTEPVLDCVASAGAVYDVVYGRKETPLVQQARANGLAAADGLSMLAEQGEVAFSHWFGQEPPLGVMQHTLKRLRAE